MGNKNQSESGEQVVDLSAVSDKMSNIFQSINVYIFKGIQFVIKHIIILIILLATGIGLGIYLDSKNKSYDHQIIVSPNFGSTDYLYSKIRLLNAKISERDTLFLKALNIKNPKRLSKIQVKPIVDIYAFINKTHNEKNFDLIRLMADEGEVTKIIQDSTTSKNYSTHTISFSTKKRTSRDQSIQPILDFLNNSSFYHKIQKEYVKNVNTKIKANEIMIAQIDAILTNLGSVSTQDNSQKLIYYNENTGLNDILQTKDKLINEQGNYKIELLSSDFIIKEKSSILNIEDKKSVKGKMKFILPLLFIAFYLCIFLFINFYKTQSQIAKSRQ